MTYDPAKLPPTDLVRKAYRELLRTELPDGTQAGNRTFADPDIHVATAGMRDELNRLFALCLLRNTEVAAGRRPWEVAQCGPCADEERKKEKGDKK